MTDSAKAVQRIMRLRVELFVVLILLVLIIRVFLVPGASG